jgi:hypothetical protein
VPAKAQRGTDLYGAMETIGREIELALGQPRDILARASLSSHEFPRRLNGHRFQSGSLSTGTNFCWGVTYVLPRPKVVRSSCL